MRKILFLLTIFVLHSCSNSENSIENFGGNNSTQNLLINRMLVTQKQGNQPETQELYYFKYNTNNKVEKILFYDNVTMAYEIKYNSNNKPIEFINYDEPQNYKFYYDTNNKLVKIVKNYTGSTQTYDFNITYENSDNTIKVNNSEVYNFSNNNLLNYSNGSSTTYSFDTNENPFYKIIDKEVFLTGNVYFEGFGEKEYMSKNVLNKSINSIQNITYSNIYDNYQRLIKVTYAKGYESYKLDIEYQ